MNGVGEEVNFYDMHDGKMLYILTQHSLYSRKHYPYLLCRCKRGAAVSDPDHVCKFLTQEEYVCAYLRSGRRWKTKKDKLETDERYDLVDHKAWVDEDNEGVSHFGIHPDHLRIDNIRFDVFHLRGAITKRLMSCLREFILKQSCDLMDRFYKEVLAKFWGDYNIDVWKLNKKFSSFVGSEVKVFIKHTSLITAFLDDNCAATEHLTHLIQGLTLWPSLNEFLKITRMQQGDKDDYLENLKKFEDELKLFYSAGGKSFLTKGTIVGDDETFYMHCLRCYIPQIARTTYDRHHLGVGIFTMQGYERRNKESKKIFTLYNNKRSYILTQQLNRLYDNWLLS